MIVRPLPPRNAGFGARAWRGTAPLARPRLARAFAFAAVITFTAGVAALAALWAHDRTRRWEAPRFDPARFVLVESAAAPDPGAETWMLAVNPSCSHCAGQVRDFVATGERMTARPTLALLVVDEPRRPDPAAFPPGADQIWWDAHAVWRGEWGHRLYGEMLRFDRRGMLMEARSPAEVAAAAPDR